MTNEERVYQSANDAAHRGMKVLCDIVETYNWPGNTIISKPDAEALKKVASDYQAVYERAQKAARGIRTKHSVFEVPDVPDTEEV